MSFEAAIHAQAIELDGLSLKMCAQAGSGHPTSAMSLGHIVTVLFFHTMRYSSEHPDYPTSDRLVLSEGHAVPIVYAAAAKLGMHVGKDPADRRPLTLDDLSTLRANDSLLDGHPNPQEGFPMFDAATGSLGQGLSVAAGLGEAARLDGHDRRVFCIVGDGESREGQIAEALDFIAERGLTNVCAIFNCNEWGQAGRVSGQQSPETLAAKLAAYGFEVMTIDGHKPDEIKSAFDAFIERSSQSDAKPIAIVAKTVKGWGAPSLQGGGWHGKPAVKDQLETALAEINDKRAELTSSLTSSDAFTIESPQAVDAREPVVADIPGFKQALEARDMLSVYQTGRLATRKAYGIALAELGKANPDVVALDGDVSNSTFSKYFADEKSISNRFIECKIAEQHMISAAAGMSAAGKVPFVSTFAKFVTRAYDQIEMAINSGANLKIIGSHAGVSLAADGPSQMSLPDVAWFRSFATMRDHRGNPGCYVLQPADAFAAYALTAVMADYEGACYMRTLRPETEFIYGEDDVFNLGGFQQLQEGRDLVLVASGYMVHEANKALQGLDDAGVSAGLVDLYSLPFDEDKLLDVVAASGGRVVTLEDNYGGGFGSAVADAISASGDGFEITQMHVSRIPKSARSEEEIMEQVGLSSKQVVQRCLELLEVATA